MKWIAYYCPIDDEIYCIQKLQGKEFPLCEYCIRLGPAF